ncbi:carboxypeptidase-like regulatory domain-containing protein [Prevotella copri]|uniref:Carboxypeptidase-like regulatory domain-containing protein n=1 Tax=Segatella copri TaxID=165179 RepID=A0AAP3BCM7_9BACT|nr:carboxypeptidase-like regulatory domain-containing protein [Segatella copri]MCW4128505.1 carboxypeptidase-like regulatory domain-containing protein [Segatella copri]
MDNKLFLKESVLPVTLFCSALMFSPIGVAQVNAATNVVQQAKTVKGTVVDNMGEPVIGASVKVVGTTNGAVTDLDGNFTLTNVLGCPVLCSNFRVKKKLVLLLTL